MDAERLFADRAGRPASARFLRGAGQHRRTVCASLAFVVALVASAEASSLGGAHGISIDGLPYTVQNAGQPWSLDDPEPGTLRFQLRPGDVWPRDPREKERSEIAGDVVYAAGGAVTVRYDFRIAPGPANTSEWLIIGQFHATDNVTNPIFAVELVGERLAVQLRHASPGDKYEQWFAFIDDEPIVRGKYYRLEARLRLKSDESGSVDVWLEGEPIVRYSGPIGYGYGVYWKQGVYRAASPEAISIDFRNLRVEGDVQDWDRGARGG